MIMDVALVLISPPVIVNRVLAQLSKLACTLLQPRSLRQEPRNDEAGTFEPLNAEEGFQGERSMTVECQILFQ